MNEYWTGFEAGLEYSKRLADARRSDAAVLLAEQAFRAAIAKADENKRQERMDRVRKLASAIASQFGHAKLDTTRIYDRRTLWSGHAGLAGEPRRVSLSHWGLYEVG